MARRHYSSRGVALISVLWVLILLSVLAAGLLRTSRTQVNLARNAVDNAQAEALAEAGLSLAVLNLLHPRAGDRWQADGSIYAWRFGGGDLRISLHDEAGKIDLNATEPALIAAFFEAAGIEPAEAAALSDALADYRDDDEEPRAQGAEDVDYEAAGYAHEAKDGPFSIIEELRLVFGMRAELYDLLAPEITVYSRQGRPRPEMTGPLVKAALDGAVYQSPEADDPGRPTRSLVEPDQDLSSPSGPVLLAAGDQSGPAHSGTLGIHVEARLDSGALFVREAVVRLAPGRLPPYHLLAWRQGSRLHFTPQSGAEFGEEPRSEVE